MAVQTFERIEKKFLITDAERNAILPELKQHMEWDKYSPEGNGYSITSVYYDTPDHRLIRQSIAKPYYKEKLRLRCYTPPTDGSQPVFLELKKKIGNVVNKRRIVLPLEQAYTFLNTGQPPAAESYLQQQVGHEIAFVLSQYHVSPKVLISYNRFALFGKDDNRLRITFDYRLRTRRTCVALEKADDCGEDLLPDGVWLMEVKFLGAMPLWISHLLNETHIYSTGFSKYGEEYKRFCLREQPLAEQRLYRSTSSIVVPSFVPHIIAG